MLSFFSVEHVESLQATDLFFSRFDILGSTLTSSIDSVANTPCSGGAISLLQDAEGNHCSSFPTILLQLIQNGARLSQNAHSYRSPTLEQRLQQALQLLSTAQSFNPAAWARDVQIRSPTSDLALRTHIASAHHAAVCIYLSRVILSLDPLTVLSSDLEALVAEIIDHLSHISRYDALFTAMTWPAFIAGAETNKSNRQEWVREKFEELWQVEPWGLMRGAREVLERIWAGKKNGVAANEEGVPLHASDGPANWITDLRSRGVDWLII